MAFTPERRQRAHDLRRGALAVEQVGHGAHGRIDMGEETLEAGAEVIQPWLAVGGGQEPVFGTAAVADETDRAFAAVARQGRFFILAELYPGADLRPGRLRVCH